MQNLDQGVVRRTVGAKFANTFVVLPATQTRGGIFIAVNEHYFQLSNQYLSTHAVTATVTMLGRWNQMANYGCLWPAWRRREITISTGACSYSLPGPWEMAHPRRF